MLLVLLLPDPVHMILDPEAGVVDHSLGAVHHSTILVQDLGTVKGLLWGKIEIGMGSIT